MRIPNKFNGYMSDGRRLYHDPASAALIANAMAAGTGTLGTAAAAGTLGTAAAGTALGTGIAAGTTLATGAGTALGTGTALAAGTGSSVIPGLVGSANTLGGLSAAAPAASSIAPTITQAASNPAGLEQLVQAFSKEGVGQGLPQLGPKLAGPADPTALFSQAGGANPVLGQASQAPTQLAETLRNTNTMMNGPAQMSYGPGSQGIAANSTPLNASAYTSPIKEGATWSQNLGNLAKNPSFKAAGEYAMEHPLATGIGAAGIGSVLLGEDEEAPPPQDPGLIRPYTLDRKPNQDAYKQQASNPKDSSEKMYFDDTYTAGTPYTAPGPEYKKANKASGGIARYAVGGPAEVEATNEAIGPNNTMYPQSQFHTPMYSNPSPQRPMTGNVVNGANNGIGFASGGMAGGGYNLGGYSDGGRLLKGPGDGVSDSIPASIGHKQPARLADGEFVIPARIVSELGNGSTDAGARRLYAMMDKVQANRKKSIGKGKVAVDSKSHKHLPK